MCINFFSRSHVMTTNTVMTSQQLETYVFSQFSFHYNILNMFLGTFDWQKRTMKPPHPATPPHLTTPPRTSTHRRQITRVDTTSRRRITQVDTTSRRWMTYCRYRQHMSTTRGVDEMTMAEEPGRCKRQKRPIGIHGTFFIYVFKA